MKWIAALLLIPTFPLLLLFIILKLSGCILWSWLWVLSPLWLPIPLAAATIAIIFIIYTIKFFIEIIKY